MDSENKKKRKLKLSEEDLSSIYHPVWTSFKEIEIDDKKKFVVNFPFRRKLEGIIGDGCIETNGMIRILGADNSYGDDVYQDIHITLEERYGISSKERAVFHNLYELALDAYLTGKKQK